ncbi:FimV/HubP family polar landmark protein [Moraxella atlantae]|uniref:Tfp pilus assembly protein FimV n=1 Tax=Faucicola atlantae TaxID=34059 RepID=A0A378Q293_9GAMM|nr:FimV/HubP family polar landmark protein [Moraxella atlantae]OPH34628.1 hypothetical protein B5J92_07070 [Moraxella atlantae]STY94879.1 Tfp pilus assembly protein FimV [Moraxella atlantae]
MTPMMMGIIAAVVIVIIVAVVLMRKKSGSDGGMATGGNRPKTLAEQQQEIQARTKIADNAPATTSEATLTSSQPSEDVLKNAQHLFDQRDYERAEQVLKPAIAREPNRSDLVLLLLNTYAVSKNYDAFNALYPTLQRFHDTHVQTQAANLKSLIDEEMAFSSAPTASAQPMTQSAAQPAMATTAASSVAPSVSAATDDSLDFNFSLDDEPTTTSQATTSTPAASAPTEPTVELDDFDFDLALDSLSTTSPTAQTPTDAVPSEKVLSSDDTELVLPTATPDSMPAQSSNDGLTLDDSLWQNATQAATTTAPTPQVTPAQNKVLSSSDTELDLSDFGDLTLDTPAQPSTSATDVPTTTTTDNTTNAFDFDDLTFELDEPAQPNSQPALNTDTPVVSAPPVDDVAQFDEIDLTFDEPSTAPAETVVEPVIEAPEAETTEFDFSNLELDVPNAIEAPASTETSTTNDAAFDWADLDPDVSEPASTTTPETPTVSTSEVFAPSAAQPSVSEPDSVATGDALRPDLSDALAQVEQLDSTTLTLELAEQYLELGEYDSAKRLLNEIAPHANGEAQARIHALLDKTY